MSQRVYKDGPFGEAIHPHLMVADTKFNANGLFHLGLKVTGKAAEKYRAEVDEAAQAAFEDFFENGDGKDMKPADRKKWEVYVPYSVEEDDEGNPTGAIIFDYKQNATIHLRDGTVKNVKIAIKDASGERDVAQDPGNGSILRVRFSMRPIPMKSLKQVGVRLDFAAVQVKELKPKGSGSGGFSAVEGYEEDNDAPQGGFGDAGGSASGGGEDY